MENQVKEGNEGAEHIWEVFGPGQAWAHQGEGFQHVILVLAKTETDLLYYEWSNGTNQWWDSRMSKSSWLDNLAEGNYVQTDATRLFANPPLLTVP